MTVDEVMAALTAKASASTRRIFQNHGAPASVLGVKVGDLKVVLKEAGKDHALALQLWDTGVGDARYLAGLMCDPRRLDEATLQRWAGDADWSMLSEYTVPWCAAESGHGWALGLRWIDDARPTVASAGWATLGSHVALTPDDRLDLGALQALLDRVVAGLPDAAPRVRYTMNGFVAAVGVYVAPLREAALDAAARLGVVVVDPGDTSCKVPAIADTVAAAVARAATKKRKAVRC